MHAQVNGITLGFTDQGTGFPLVFLHAFPLNRIMWVDQEKTLSSQFRVITIDLRGHGESDAPLWHYSLDQAADDVRGLLDHLSRLLPFSAFPVRRAACISGSRGIHRARSAAHASRR